jgi:hypothetical protein
MMANMSFAMNPMPFSIVPLGGEACLRTFNTIGITTTHVAVRGT